MVEDGKLYSKGRNYFAIGLISLTMLAFSATARADGFYADVHGGTGITWNGTTRVSSDVAPSSVKAHTNYDVGWLAGASAGYAWDRWNQGFATEFEFTFRQNHIDRIATSTPLTVGGDLHSYNIMLNGYYRFKNSTPFTPYIGGGLGEASIALNNTRSVSGLNTGPFSGTDAVFAYQGIAGVSYPIAPHLGLAAEYRYFATVRPGFQQTVAGQEVKISPDYAVNNVLLRVVYSF
jgi:opacity protein-like surface antigen